MSLMLQVLNVVSGLELARGLGVTGRGELAAAILWPTVIGAIATLGLQESITYHVARDRANAGRLLGSALTLCALQSIVFTAISAAVVPLALHQHSGTVITAGLIYTGYVSINVYGLLLVGTVNGLHRYGLYNAGVISTGVSIVALQTVLLAIGAFHVKTIVIGMIACYLACMVFATWLTKLAHPGRLRADRKTMRMIFAYGVKSNTSTTSSFLNQRLDQLVISAFLTAHQLGIYVVAVTFTLFAPLLGGAIAIAALPNVARLTEAGEQQLLARRMVSFTLISATLVSLPIVILAPFLIKIFFGSAYSVGGSITRVTAVASVSFATTRSLEAVLRGIGRPLAAGMAEFVALGATAACLGALLPTLGLIGAAWASLIAYSTSGAWMAWRIRTITGLPIRKLLTPDREGVAEAVDRFRSLRNRGSQPAPEERPGAAILAALRDGPPDDREAFFGGPQVLPGVAIGPPAQLAALPDEATSDLYAPAEDPPTSGPDPGAAPDRSATVTASPEPRYGLWELMQADYAAEYPARHESPRTRMLLFPLRSLSNPCLRAVLLVRLQLGAPVPLSGVARRILGALHSIEIGDDTRIGPALRLPHPARIRVDRAVLGRRNVLHNRVTIAPGGGAPRVVRVGDDVRFSVGATVTSPVSIGDGATIGPGAAVGRDVAPGERVTARGPLSD